MVSSRYKIAVVLSIATLTIGIPAGAAPAGSLSPYEQAPKPGTTNATVDMMPPGSGQLNGRAHAVDETLEKWSFEHPNVVAEHTTSGSDLVVEVRTVGDELGSTHRRSIEQLVLATDADAKVTYRVVDVAPSEIEALVRDARDDLEALRVEIGAVSVNRNHDDALAPARTRVVVAVDGSVDLASANDYLRDMYGPYVAAELSTYRTS